MRATHALGPPRQDRYAIVMNILPDQLEIGPDQEHNGPQRAGPGDRPPHDLPLEDQKPEVRPMVRLRNGVSHTLNLNSGCNYTASRLGINCP